jgi:molecular chaperone HscB
MDPFAILGAPRSFSVDLKALEKTHRELSRALHPDRFVNASASERREALARAVEVNEAWRVVRDPIRRAEALLALRGVVAVEGREPPADPDFLMDMLEQREALGEARQARDAATVRRMARDIEVRSVAVERRLADGLGAPGGEPAPLVALVGELRFYRRFLDEVRAIEDDLAGVSLSP